MGRLGPWISKQIWRLRQAQSYYAIIYGAFTIAALYSPFVKVLPEGLQGTIIFALIVIAIFLAFGYVYDKKLKLWEADAKVQADRNPYTSYLERERENITPKGSCNVR